MTTPYSPALSPPERRRGRKRLSCRHDAILDLGEHLPGLPCVVTDLDSNGARLTLAAPRPLPTDVRLLLPTSRVAFQATIRWRRGQVCGVTFLDRRDLDAPAP